MLIVCIYAVCKVDFILVRLKCGLLHRALSWLEEVETFILSVRDVEVVFFYFVLQKRPSPDNHIDVTALDNLLKLIFFFDNIFDVIFVLVKQLFKSCPLVDKRLQLFLRVRQFDLYVSFFLIDLSS
jgi:hypothetical protein